MAGRRGLCLLLLLLCALLRAAAPAGERRSASCRRRLLEPTARPGPAAASQGSALGCSVPPGCGASGGERCGGHGRALGGAEPRRRAGFWGGGARSGLGEVAAVLNGFGKVGPAAAELQGPAGEGAARRPPRQVVGGEKAARRASRQAGLPARFGLAARGLGGGGCPARLGRPHPPPCGTGWVLGQHLPKSCLQT